MILHEYTFLNTLWSSVQISAYYPLSDHKSPSPLQRLPLCISCLPALRCLGPPQNQVAANSLIFHTQICAPCYVCLSGGMDLHQHLWVHIMHWSHCNGRGFPPDPDLPCLFVLWIWSHLSRQSFHAPKAEDLMKGYQFANHWNKHSNRQWHSVLS